MVYHSSMVDSRPNTPSGKRGGRVVLSADRFEGWVGWLTEPNFLLTSLVRRGGRCRTKYKL